MQLFLNGQAILKESACPISFTLTVALIVLTMGFGSCSREAEPADSPLPTYLPEIEHMALVLLPSQEDSGTYIRPRACFMDKYEVTVGQYGAFLEVSGYRPDDDVGFLSRTPLAKGHPGIVGEGDDEYPVVCVSYHDALAYASRYGKEIPNREEWLAAAQISPDRPYPWGDRFNKFFCNSLRSGLGAPVRVGTFESGRSPYDCYAMAGNVAEWTSERAGGSDVESGVDVFYVMGGHFDKWGYPTKQRKIFDILNSPEIQESHNRIAHIGFRCVRPDAVPLMARFAERIAALRPEQRPSALRELSYAGKEVTSVLQLLDFIQRSKIVRRAAGSFLLDRLGDVNGDGKQELLLKRPTGKVTVISGLGDLLWTMEEELGFFDELVLLRDDSGTVENLVVLEKTAARIGVRNPATGLERWTAQAAGEPQAVIQVRRGGAGVLVTTWLGKERIQGEQRDRSYVTCHDKATGRLIWEKKIDGMLTSLVKNERSLVMGVLRQGLGLRSFELLSIDDGMTIDAALLGGERTVELIQSGDGPGRIFAVDGPTLPEAVLPEAEPIGLVDRYARRPFLSLVVSAIELMAEGARKSSRENLPARLEIGESSKLEGAYFSRSDLAQPSVGKTVIDSNGQRSDEAARALCERFLESEYRIRRVLAGSGFSWFLTEPDRQNRIALFSVRNDRAVSITVLDSVRGFNFKALLAPAGGANGGVARTLLIWSSGGDMICLDAKTGAFRWWRRIHSYSGYEALVASTDDDSELVVIAFSPYGEITIIGLETGLVEARFKKAGAEITDLDVVDVQGTGKVEVFPCFKDEGLYSLDPRRLEPQSAIDITLAGMLALEKRAARGGSDDSW